MKFPSRFVVTVLLAALGVLSGRAQDSISYGSVGGRVTDPSGATVPRATILLRQLATNIAAGAETGDEGRFKIGFLPAGDYQLTLTKSGFTPVTRQLRVSAGSGFEVALELGLAGGREDVTVMDEVTLIESARTQVASTLGQSEIASLPLNGRSFLDLALLVPGVSPTNTGSNQLFAETSAVPGQGISVGSQRNFSNTFLVDGLSANDDAAGLSGVFYGLGAVEEMQVVTSGGQAEIGRALAGTVNITTRNGGNQMHGDAYGFFRNQRLNAANPLSNSKLPMTQAQYGASLGGPVRRDRLFYFGNFEQKRLQQSGLTTITAANAAAINARLAQLGYAGGTVSTGIYPNPVAATNFLAKLDGQAGRESRLMLRYSLYDVTSRNSRGAGALNAPSASAGLDDRDQTLAAGYVSSLSANTLNELRGQYTRSSLAALPTDSVGPAVNIAGVAVFGTLSGSPTGRKNHLYEVVDNLTHHTGAHALRVGVGFLFNSTDIVYPRSNRGSYAFSSLANFLAGTYNNAGFTQTFGATRVTQNNPNLGFYAQDEWKATAKLTFNIGVRYDLQWLESIQTDRNNVSPRAGFAFTPFRSRQTVVRGSYGLFYDRVPLRAVANALLSAGNTTDIGQLRQTSISLSPGQAGAPVFPNILGAPVPLVTLVNLTTMDRRMQNAYAQQGGLEIEQQIGRRASVTAGFQHLRGIRLIVSVNQNVPTCVAAGTNNGCRPNPNYANNSRYSAQADSNYNALHLSFTQRPAGWGSYRISYAWSKALNNVGEFFFSSPIDPANLWRDYGRSDDDQRHRVTVNGSLRSSTAAARSPWQRLTHGFELGGMLQYYSALPMNITSGVTTIQGTAGRPIVNGGFIGRNAGVGNDFLNLNIRASRTLAISEFVKLQFIAEGFNSLNHRNNLTKNGNFGAGAFPTAPSATFNQVTAVNDPRGLQLALKLSF